MISGKRRTLIATTAVIMSSAEPYSAGVAQMHSAEHSVDPKESTQTKIAGLLSMVKLRREKRCAQALKTRPPNRSR